MKENPSFSWFGRTKIGMIFLESIFREFQARLWWSHIVSAQRTEITASLDVKWLKGKYTQMWGTLFWLCSCINAHSTYSVGYQLPCHDGWKSTDYKPINSNNSFVSHDEPFSIAQLEKDLKIALAIGQHVTRREECRQSNQMKWATSRAESSTASNGKPT